MSEFSIAATRETSTILIVEDEAVVAVDLETSLEELGFHIAGVAESADDAVALADRFRPDLALMDIQLRGARDGISAAQELRERWGIPVIFITANTNSDNLTRAKASGPYGFLSKPFRPKELEAAISIALHQHRVTQSLFSERSWFSTTMNSLTDGVIATDENGAIRFMNPAAERMTNWSKAEALGKAIEAVYTLTTLAGEDLDQCQLRRAIARREPVAKKRFLMNVKGMGSIPVEDAASPILEQGQLLGAVTTFVDISDRLQAEGDAADRQEQLQQEVNTTSHVLGETQEELRALSRYLMAGQEEVQRRIARELHDDLGQQAALLGMKLFQMAEMAPDSMLSAVSSISSDLGRLSTALRDVSHRLHPVVLDDLGLAEALRSLVAESKASNLKIYAAIDEVPFIPSDVSTSLYRVAQESLQNVRKHAPDAAVYLTLSCEGGELTLRVQDEGPGFSVEEVRRKGGLGLVSMQERARLAGGSLVLTTRPNEGTSVVVRIMLRS